MMAPIMSSTIPTGNDNKKPAAAGGGGGANGTRVDSTSKRSSKRTSRTSSKEHHQAQHSRGDFSRERQQPREKSEERDSAVSRGRSSTLRETGRDQPSPIRTRRTTSTSASPSPRAAGFPPPSPSVARSPTTKKASTSTPKKKNPAKPLQGQPASPSSRRPPLQSSLADSATALSSDPSACSTTTTSLSRSRLIENPSSASDHHNQNRHHHQKQQRQQQQQREKQHDSSWDHTNASSADASGTTADHHHWVPNIADMITGSSHQKSSKTKMSASNSILLPSPIATAKNKIGTVSSSTPSPPKGIFNIQSLFGTATATTTAAATTQEKNKNNRQKVKIPPTVDMLTLGSSDTMTAGDFTDINGSQDNIRDVVRRPPQPPQPASLLMPNKQYKELQQQSFFPEEENRPFENFTSNSIQDIFRTRERDPPKNNNNNNSNNKKKHKEEELTGEYLAAKLMQLGAVQNPRRAAGASTTLSSNRRQYHYSLGIRSTSQDSQEEDDDNQTFVSNLTNPTFVGSAVKSFDNNNTTATSANMMRPPKSPRKRSASPTRPPLPRTTSASQNLLNNLLLESPLSTSMLSSTSSWGLSPRNNDAVLGKALDMQLYSSQTNQSSAMMKADTNNNNKYQQKHQLLQQQGDSSSPLNYHSSEVATFTFNSDMPSPLPANQTYYGSLSPRRHRKRSASPAWRKRPKQQMQDLPLSPNNTPLTATQQRHPSPFRRKMESVVKSKLYQKQQEKRSISAAPAHRYSAAATSPEMTASRMQLGRSKSAQRASQQHKLETVSGKSEHYRSLKSLTSRNKGASSSSAARSRMSSSTKMEPLSQVMSRAPSSSMGSQLRPISVQSKSKITTRSYSPVTRKTGRSPSPRATQRNPKKVAKSPSPAATGQPKKISSSHSPAMTRQPKNFIEANRRAISSHNSRGTSTTKKTSAGDIQTVPKVAAKRQKPSPIQTTPSPGQTKKASSFPKTLSDLKAMRSPSRAVTVEKPKTCNKPKYVPRNAYVGRFTPKKKDKLSEIMESRKYDAEDYRYPISLLSRKKFEARKAGAQKLRNMIKLKNHFADFTSDSRSGSRSSFYNNLAAVPISRQSKAAARPSKTDRMSMIREHGLIDSFSVGGASDLRSLRSAVQSRVSDHRRESLYRDNSYFDQYDESRIHDPMKRAGVRLLSTAIIPIQAMARRFLIRRQVLTMLWGALVIQSRVRSFLLQTRYEIKLYAAMRIQAAARGMIVRDRLMFEDYCATEIQRRVRGYIASIHVYEKIYHISLVQAQVRMRLAIKDATIRMYCVLRIQAVARSHVVRSRLAEAHNRATTIQRCVRGYLSVMHVYEEIYKVTIVQNCVRRKQAIDKATIRMSLILSLQAIARGYLVRCRLNLAHYHAGTIQRYVRGYLGTMKVYEEIYNIIFIQNVLRMKLASNLATRRMGMIITVQANWRRYCVMRRLEYATYNATIIQRYVRGYLSAITVYEEIYKITLVQNFVRMKKAKALANQRRMMICRTQAIARGFILRERLTKIREKAVTIQTAWKSFYYRLVYQFKLLDVIIVQSAWRRRVARCEANQRRNVLQAKAATIIQTRWRCYDANETYLQYRIEDRAATIIQTKWRCYDTSMDFLHYLADILIVQSLIRRWFAMRKVTSILEKKSIFLQRVARGYLGRVYVKKTKSATTIQKTWRGFVSFADFMFKVADIVMLQTLARRLLACKRADYLRHKLEHDAAYVIQSCRRRQLEKREHAAIMIQKTWRGLVQEADFTITLYEYRSARTIQTYWRRFWKFSNYLICLDCSIRIQAVTRGFLARCKYADQQWGAVIIQAAARGIVGRRQLTSNKMLESQRLTSQAIGSLQSMAAIVVQAQVRGFLGRGATVKYIAAIVIQTCYRESQDRVFRKTFAAAAEIQKHWRRTVYQAAYTRFLAARRMQTFCRSVQSRKLVLVRRAEFVAATYIQSAWRGYAEYANFSFTICDIVKVQSACRRLFAIKKSNSIRVQNANAAAVKIQKAWRGFYFQTCFLITVNEIVRIQRLAKRYVTHQRYLTEQAMKIQRTWRMYFCRSNYTFIITDVIKVQSQARRFLAQQLFLEMWEDHAIKSVVKIQSRWRAHVTVLNYTALKEDIITIQSAARMLLACYQKNRYKEDRIHLYATMLQASWRRHKDEVEFHKVISKIRFLQYYIRRYLIIKDKESMAATYIQAAMRGHFDRSDYTVTCISIVKLQSVMRMFLAKSECQKLGLVRDTKAATKIQAAYRGWTTYADYICKRSAVLDMQRYWRGFSGRICLFIAWKQHVAKVENSAKTIQKIWRGYVTQQLYLYRLGSAIELQSFARMVVVQTRALRQKEAAMTIQSERRRNLAKLELLDLISRQACYLSRVSASTVSKAASSLQLFWRRAKHRKYAAKQAMVIQSFVKQVMAKRFLERQIAARKLCVFFRVSYNKRLPAVERLAIKMNSSATKIQTWYSFVHRLRQCRKERAARIIIRFFRMVQREVDEAIEREMQRRKQKEVLKKRAQKRDEALLDSAWNKTSGKGLLNQFRKTGTPPSPKQQQQIDEDELLQETLDDMQRRGHQVKMFPSPSSASMTHYKAMLPSPIDVVDDDSSVDTGCAAPMPMPPSCQRVALSRMSFFSEQDLDEDYCLEEAFLDVEIHSAKSRREKKSSRSNSGNSISIGISRSGSSSCRRRRRPPPHPKVMSSCSSCSVGGSVSSRRSTGTRDSTASRSSNGARNPSHETRYHGGQDY